MEIAVSDARAPHLHSWRHRTVLAAAGLSVAAGYGQFAIFTALGDVAVAFGESGTSALGLSGTQLGAGLALVRLAALGGLPLAALADSRGRRSVLLTTAAAGLAFSAAAAFSPGYWWFIALFALGRPLLSATNAICGVIAAEETGSRDRAKAVALITAAYGTGAGLTAILRPFLPGTGFRTLFALTLVPLAALPLLARLLEEPERFRVARTTRPRLDLGAVPRQLRPRLGVLCLLAVAGSFTTSPLNAYIFAYAERVLGLSPAATAVVAPAAAVTGGLGLLAGRWAADHLGRRSTSVAMHVLVGVAGVLTYTRSPGIAIGGYLLGLLAGSAYAPAVGALSAEIFPTAERATAAGWLTAAAAVGAVTGLFTFGWLVDTLDSFLRAALLVSVPVAVTAPLYLRLPETRGLELEQSAPEELVAS
jgi:MFS family permease